MPTSFSLTQLARIVASAVAATCGLDEATVGEREVLRRVALRPIEGVRVWRTPVVAAVAGRTDPAPWLQAVQRVLEEVPHVAAVERRGATLDITLADPGAVVPPQAVVDTRLWAGAPDRLVVTVPPADEPHASPAREPDRARLAGEMLAAMVRACGDQVETRIGETGQVTLARSDDAPQPTQLTRRVAPGVVTGLTGPVGSISPAHGAAVPHPEVGATPVSIAWLSVPLQQPVRVPAAALWSRGEDNAGFVLAHALQLARGAAERGASGGSQALLIALAAYPFVLEKAAVAAEPHLLVRHLVRCARAVRMSVWQPGAGPVPATAAAAVLGAGMEACGLRAPSRI